MLGGHAVAQCLRNEGVKHIFSVPGESYIAVVDGLVNFPEIKLITNRQEGCAAFMAEGYAKATRTPGVCIVTRGPGATNASIAVQARNTIRRRWCFWSAKSVAMRAAAKPAKRSTTDVLRQHRQMGDRDQRS